ncbi:MFS transporter [Sphingomonas sp. 22R3R2A-7]|uniref:MFS transporter n=1 Tax=Sphingomonas sp. 22R3R2A-7 TaxID=3050230 RepID=UPI002FE1125D
MTSPNPTAATSAIATASADQGYPPPLRAWTILLLLFVASIVSVIDRGLLNIVVDGVKSELLISDVQIGLLQGLAFGLFYAVMGVWLGVVADRTSRRWLIVIGIFVWSCATIGGGLAGSFGELFLSRLLVGLGEAALAPAAISLIADLFPPGRRGRAVGFYIMGQAIAQGVSISVAGFLLGAAARGDFAGWPILGGLAPWRTVFVVCGLAGTVVALAFLATREPPRRGAVMTTTRESWGSQVSRTLAHFWTERSKFVAIYLGFAAFFLGTYGAFAWQVAMISRKFGVTPAEVAPLLGPMAIVSGLLGPIVGGWIVDRIVKRSGHDAIPKLLVILPFVALPSACAVLAPSLTLACVLCGSLAGITAMVGAATLTYLQAEAPADMRGMAISITGLMNTVFGAALGPVLVAVLTQHVFGRPELVGYAILCVAVPAYLVAAFCFARVAGANRTPAFKVAAA